jgi:hypothetical protein
VLVFPDVRTSSFVVGAQTGDGVMFRDGQVAGYYRIGDAAAGLEAGAESYSYALFFMSDAALQRLRDARAFDTSRDPDIVFINVDEADEISAVGVRRDYGDVFGEASLTGGVSPQGLTITPVDR